MPVWARWRDGRSGCRRRHRWKKNEPHQVLSLRFILNLLQTFFFILRTTLPVNINGQNVNKTTYLSLHYFTLSIFIIFFKTNNCINPFFDDMQRTSIILVSPCGNIVLNGPCLNPHRMDVSVAHSLIWTSYC